MIEFLRLDSPAYAFYLGLFVKLEGMSDFGKVQDWHGKTAVGREYAESRRIVAFVFPGEPGFVVEGSSLALFAEMVGRVAEAAYEERYKIEYRFEAVGNRSIDLITSRFGGEVVLECTLLAEELQDQRHRLVTLFNAGITTLRKELNRY